MLDQIQTTKILFIHHATGWGGAPNSMIKLINNLDKSKFDVQVLLLKDSILTKILKEHGIKYHVAKSGFYQKHYYYFTHSEAGYIKYFQWLKFFKFSLLWLLSRYFFAKKELSKFNPDIIHLNSSVLTDWLAPSNKKAKTIIHIREPFRKGNFDFLHFFFTNQMKKYAHQIIAISQDNALRIGIANKTTIIYNFADVPETNSLKNSYSSRKVLYLGGSAEIKGFYTIASALKYLEKNVSVYFAGSYHSEKKTIKGKLKSILGFGRRNQKFIRVMRNSSHSIELGLIHNVDEYMEEVCCVVSPFSSPHFARPVIEAYLHKKPAIGSNVQGMEEIIVHGLTGLLFEKDNPKALANTINYLVNHPQKALEMGEKGRQKALEKFSPKNMEKVGEIYTKLVE